MHMEIDMLTQGPPDGLFYFIDMSYAKLFHLTKINPLMLKQVMYYLQRCYPARLKGFHMLKTIPLLDKIVALIKQFLEDDFADKLYVHETMQDLHKFVSPPSILPREYEGGEEEPADVIQGKCVLI